MGWVHNATEEISDRSQWPTILAVVLILTLVMLTTVALRGYVRGIMLKSMGNDDWVILFSAICSVIYGGLAIGQTKWGLGLNLPDRPKVDLNQYSMINFVGRPFYMTGITGFKVALCISYLRILQQSNRVYNTIVWAVMISCIVLHAAGTLVLLFQCKPVRKSWIPATVGTCLPNDKTFYTLAGVTIFYDCVIFLLPIPILMQLQINMRRKMALIGVFVLGLFTTICSIMRLIQIITIAKTGNSTMLVLWGTIEMNVGISLCCIPTLTPLFTYFREKASTLRYGYKNNSHSQPQENSGGHSLNILKSGQQNRSRIAETSSSRWKDRDSYDNNSQKGIMEQGLHLHENGGPDDGGESGIRPNKGTMIMTTTRVEVSVEDAERPDQSEKRASASVGRSKWSP